MHAVGARERSGRDALEVPQAQQGARLGVEGTERALHGAEEERPTIPANAGELRARGEQLGEWIFSALVPLRIESEPGGHHADPGLQAPPSPVVDDPRRVLALRHQQVDAHPLHQLPNLVVGRNEAPNRGFDARLQLRLERAGCLAITVGQGGA